MKREGRSPTAETRPDGRAEVSVVLPMLNEEEVVLRTYRRLKAVVEQLDVSYELLFVDDGSSDSTADTIL
ncbi:MAG: glycosyltransferase, partial [Burkholderiaceae bacterium]